MFELDPLGVAIAVGYLARKENEVANLRIIAEGVALKIKPESIRREMILL
jgi:vacuolar-type H+-ATPase subunit C/Vma6